MIEKEIFSPYAMVALAAKKELSKIEKKLKVVKNREEEKILKRQRGDIKSLINRSFRLTGDFMPVHLSERAKEYCDIHGLGDISKIGWNAQAKFEKKLNRNHCELKHEHKTTVGTLVGQLCKTETLDEAIQVFENQEIVWVTKDEDKKLSRSNRPDSDKAYRDAGIKIIRNKNRIGQLFV